MEERRASLFFRSNDELHATAVGRVLWQTVRRPRNGRLAAAAEQRGPYEVSYSIENGYPDREILLP